MNDDATDPKAANDIDERPTTRLAPIALETTTTTATVMCSIDRRPSREQHHIQVIDMLPASPVGAMGTIPSVDGHQVANGEQVGQRLSLWSELDLKIHRHNQPLSHSRSFLANMAPRHQE